MIYNYEMKGKEIFTTSFSKWLEYHGLLSSSPTELETIMQVVRTGENCGCYRSGIPNGGRNILLVWNADEIFVLSIRNEESRSALFQLLQSYWHELEKCMMEEISKNEQEYELDLVQLNIRI